MKELTLSEIQQESIYVLKKFIDICEENHFTYCLAYGTLLGVIRHKGYIPWDDDIDVWMPRDDYEKFIQYCIDNESQMKPFELKHYRTCKEYIYPIARLSDSRYINKYTNAKDYGLGLFIDIYPLDGIDLQDRKYFKKLRKKIRFIARCGTDHFIRSRNFIKTILKIPFYIYSRFVNLNKQLEKLDKMAQKYKFRDSEFFSCMVWDFGKQYNRYEIRELIDGAFENLTVKIPIGYDNLLTIEYGNYMQLPPEEERIGHHFYKVYEK